MHTQKTTLGMSVLAAVLLSGVVYGVEGSSGPACDPGPEYGPVHGAEYEGALERTADVEPLEAPARIGEKSSPMGCNNFATLISGAVSEDEALTAPWSAPSARTTSTLGGISVSIYRLNGQSWVKEATTYTGSDGHYEFCEVPNGTYRVRFCHPDFLQEYWNNKTTFSTSNTLVISTLVKQVTGINAFLEPGDGPDDCP